MVSFGPRTFSGDTKIDENVTTFGPVTAAGNLSIRNVRSFGPLVVRGNLDSDSAKSFGPMNVSGDLKVNHVSVNGPAIIGGDMTINYGRINGPLDTDKLICNEYMQINGVLEAEEVEGKVLQITGNVNVQGKIIASEKVIIRLGLGSASKFINAEKIIAPIVEIRRNPLSLIAKAFGMILGRSQASKSFEIDVPIKADTLILDGVENKGQITAGEVIDYSDNKYLN